MSYTPPLRDMRFVLEDVLQAPEILSALPAYAEVDADLIGQILEEAGKFAAEIVHPLNATGDHQGCRFHDGKVTTPEGFAEAYRQFCEGGWPALACDPAYGGQGLPLLINTILYEMLSATNQGWTMYPGLAHGAYACLQQFASEELKDRYLGKIVSGEWLPTMCLTEAHAGSDLSLLRTRAIPQEDGSYQIHGSKIFISGGDHDLTGNIIHLVLARLPDAPAGSRGLSLFLVPKLLADGTMNKLACTGIESKMGLHGSATTSMLFEGASGWLVGDLHRGLQAMFVMMNSARLYVGVQGLGLGEAAYQKSLAYAKERIQSRAPGDTTASAIVRHPAVQRLLMKQRSYNEGNRMFAYWAALLIDQAEASPDAGQSQHIPALLGLVTPVIKAMMTDCGFQGASDALQVFGGHGYVTETGIEQYVRDARITMLYEGTNEIQAVDFVMRKVLPDQGAAMELLLGMVEKTIDAASGCGHETHAQQLHMLVTRWRSTLQALMHQMVQRPLLPYELAPEMLRVAGHIALGWMWLRAQCAATQKMAEDTAFYQGKMATAAYYFGFVFTEVYGVLATIDVQLSAHHSCLLPPDLIVDNAS